MLLTDMELQNLLQAKRLVEKRRRWENVYKYGVSSPQLAKCETNKRLARVLIHIEQRLHDHWMFNSYCVPGQD